MNATLFKKEMRENRWKLITGTGLLTLLAVATPLLYEMIAGLLLQAPAGYDWALNLMPPGMLDDYTVYLWSQWNNKNLFQIGILLAVLLGMSTVAGEVSGQTISFLLTRPLSRRAVYLSKVFAGLLMLAAAVAVSTVLMLAVAFAATTQVIDATRILVATGITFTGLAAVYMLSVFFSTWLDDPVKAGGITIVLLMAMSVLGWFRATRAFSLFTHIGGGVYVLTGQFPLLPILVIIAAAVGLLVAGLSLMEAKEF